MCRPATCRTCGLATWKGCGMHVQQVLGGVPHAQRCQGHDAPEGAGLLARLLRR
jgi:hypothetical protein